MFKNRLVNAVLAGIAGALAVAGPLVDDGLSPSEIVAVTLAFLASGGFAATPPKSGLPPAE